MGSGGSKHTETIHHYHTEYVPNPETVAALAKAEEDIAILEKEAEELGDPNYFSNNIGKLFDNFVTKVSSLKLNDIIDKKPGETHVGFIGPVTAGKSSFANVMYGLTEEVALGHCTSGCEVVHTTESGLVIWDMFGADNDFKYYKPETLSFVKNLDYCVIMFDSDISVVSWIIKTIYLINPNSVVIVRTKVDQCCEDSTRTVEEERNLDMTKVQELLGLAEPIQTYAVSTHNVKYHRGKRFDWDVLREMLYPGHPVDNDDAVVLG